MTKTNDATRATGEALLGKKVSLIMGRIDYVDNLIHAAWMAAGSINGDGRTAERDALQAVIHLAGETLQEVRGELRRIGGAA